MTIQKSNKKMRPFLRWAGSKRKILNHLSPYWRNEFNRYIEPFMGSACLYFDIKPDNALLGDINPHLVETFIVVRDHAKSLHEYLMQMPQGKEHYYKIRDMEPELMDEIARAARFIYLNRFCFNGLYRTNSKGHFNVPYSPSGTGKLPNWDKFNSISEALKNVEIICADFESVLDKAQPGDFVYLDPPYAKRNSKITYQYGPDCFGINDLERLRNSLIVLNQKGVHFVVSYAKCHEALTAFSNWNIQNVLTQRNIAGFAKHRKQDSEIIVSN